MKRQLDSSTTQGGGQRVIPLRESHLRQRELRLQGDGQRNRLSPSATAERDVARPHARLFEILLMVFLGPVKRRCRDNLGDDRPLKDASLLQSCLGVSRRGFLLRIMEEDRRTVLCAEVRSLAIEGGRVVALKKNG